MVNKNQYKDSFKVLCFPLGGDDSKMGLKLRLQWTHVPCICMMGEALLCAGELH